MSKILSTTDFNMFRRLKGNRAIDKAFLNKLIAEIAKDNRLQYNPITINGNNEIIDGQHRLTAAEKLKLPIYYIVNPNATIEEAKRENVFQHEWKYRDYLESYVELGYPEYVTLEQFIKEYQLSLYIGMLLAFGEYSSPARLRNKFKLGQFSFTDKQKAENMASFINELKEFCIDNAWMQRDFLRALSLVYDKLDQKLFLKKLAQYHEKIERQVSAKEFIHKFEIILNRGVHEGNETRLY